MTIQGIFLLHKMKKVQNSPNDRITVDTFSNTLETANTNIGNRKCVYLNDKYWNKHLSPTLDDLNNSGLISLTVIDFGGNCICSITSKGHYFWQHSLGYLFNFIAKSIATPIIVSIITTYVTLKIFGQI